MTWTNEKEKEEFEKSMERNSRLDEMEMRYFNRTLEHIHRVHKNMFLLITKYHRELELNTEDKRLLAVQVLKHDLSKFSVAQFEPYIELTEYYHQRKALGNRDYQYPSQNVKDKVNEAVTDHYMQENHHAERHGGQVSRFEKFELIEVICDLQAMAQEFNEGSCREFFEQVWGPKYKMTPFASCFMSSVIKCFEKEDKGD